MKSTIKLTFKVTKILWGLPGFESLVLCLEVERTNTGTQALSLAYAKRTVFKCMPLVEPNV